MHTLERNKATIRTLFDDVLSAGRVSLIPELFVPDSSPEFPTTVAVLRGAFPDIHYTIEDLVAEGDRVAIRFTWTGTHTNPFRQYAATQKAIRSEGQAVFTLRDHRITNIAMLTDRLGFLQQIGAVPTP